ncbi:mucin-2-like isoform X2 [Ptychodera flava]
MAWLPADKSSKVSAVILMVLMYTTLLHVHTGAADLTSATPGHVMTLLYLTSMQLSASISASSGTDAVTESLTNVTVECFEWTEWMDGENGTTLDPSSIGEFERINDLRGPYGFCNETIGIECALADNTSIPYNETGQVGLTCDLEQGFLCFHSEQSGDCFNYAIRVLCPVPCPSLITPNSTIVPSSDTSKIVTIVSATIAGVVVMVVIIGTLIVVYVKKGSKVAVK